MKKFIQAFWDEITTMNLHDLVMIAICAAIVAGWFFVAWRAWAW